MDRPHRARVFVHTAETKRNGCCHNRLQSLVKLSVQSNRLTSMRGLEACTALQELYLSHNGIEILEVSLAPGFDWS